VSGPGPDVIVATEPLREADAVVEEEDTYLVLSADPEIHDPEVARLRAFHEAYTAEPAEPGGVVVRGGSPLRFLAVVHDLSQDPSCREEWVGAALEGVVREANSRRVRTLAMPPLGRVHGSLAMERFVALLHSAVRSCTPCTIERICLVVPEEEVEAFRKLFGTALWS
jgi:hypothetical protein